MKKVTVIAIVKNEPKNDVKRMIDTFFNQTYPIDEFILVSNKKYYDYRIKVIINDGDRGMKRNLAVKEARNNYILSTDTTIYPVNYVEEMMKGFENSEFVSGYTYTFGWTYFPFFIKNHYGSSRCLGFTKELWEKAGGYPENMNSAEDEAFNLRCKQFSKMYEVPHAICFWKLRDNFKELTKQFKSYGSNERHVNFSIKKRLTRLFLPLIIPIEIIKYCHLMIKTILIVRLTFWFNWIKGTKEKDEK